MKKLDGLKRKIGTIALIAFALLFLIVGFSGNYGVSNMDSLHLSDFNGTATPNLLVNQRGSGVIAVFQDAGTPIATWNNGGTFVSGGSIDLNGQQLIMDVNGNTSLTADTDDQIDIEISGSDVMSLTATQLNLNTMIANQDLNVENTGQDKTIVTQVITWTAAAGGTGTLATITDGEIWFVHSVFIRTTTNFDATGDDVTFIIGDDLDVDGFIVATDTELQAAFTEATGYAAGWYGIENGSGGAYTLDDGGPFVYAPSGGDQTIDWLLDETSGETITAGEMTAYLIYTRIQ